MQRKCGFEEKAISRGKALRSFNDRGKQDFARLKRIWTKRHHSQSTRASAKSSKSGLGIPELSIYLCPGEKLVPIKLLGVGPLKMVLQYRNNKTNADYAVKLFTGPLNRTSKGYQSYVRLCKKERKKLLELDFPKGGFVRLIKSKPYCHIEQAFGWPCLIEQFLPGLSLSECKDRLSKRVHKLAYCLKRGWKNDQDLPCAFSEAMDDMKTLANVIPRVANILRNCKSQGFEVKWNKDHLSPLDLMMPGTFLDPSFVVYRTQEKPFEGSKRWPFPVNILKLANELLGHHRLIYRMSGIEMIDADLGKVLRSASLLHHRARQNQTIVTPDMVSDLFNFKMEIRQKPDKDTGQPLPYLASASATTIDPSSREPMQL